MILKVELYDEKIKKKAMRTVSGLSGIPFLTSSNSIQTPLFSSLWIGNRVIMFFGVQKLKESLSRISQADRENQFI